jgi:hypothetical protein
VELAAPRPWRHVPVVREKEKKKLARKIVF